MSMACSAGEPWRTRPKFTLGGFITTSPRMKPLIRNCTWAGNGSPKETVSTALRWPRNECVLNTATTSEDSPVLIVCLVIDGDVQPQLERTSIKCMSSLYLLVTTKRYSLLPYAATVPKSCDRSRNIALA